MLELPQWAKCINQGDYKSAIDLKVNLCLPCCFRETLCLPHWVWLLENESDLSQIFIIQHWFLFLITKSIDLQTNSFTSFLLANCTRLSWTYYLPVVLNDCIDHTKPWQTKWELLVCIYDQSIRYRDTVKSPPGDTHTHTSMLTHSLLSDSGKESDSCCQTEWAANGGGAERHGKHLRVPC